MIIFYHYLAQACNSIFQDCAAEASDIKSEPQGQFLHKSAVLAQLRVVVLVQDTEMKLLDRFKISLCNNARRGKTKKQWPNMILGFILM